MGTAHGALRRLSQDSNMQLGLRTTPMKGQKENQLACITQLATTTKDLLKHRWPPFLRSFVFFF